MAISNAARVVLIVSLLALKGPVGALGAAGVTAQEAPDLYTAETPLFHSSTFSDERVSQIGRLSTARLLSPDRFVFLDLSLNWLVFVDASDGGVVTAGREGEGPHEFKLPILVGRSRDGGVVVWDGVHRRFALVNADGTFAEPPVYERSAFALVTTRVVARYADGTVVIADDGFPIGLPGEQPPPGPFRNTVRYQTLAPNEPARSIARFLDTEMYYEKQGSRGRTRSIIFSHRLHDAQVGQHLAVAQTDLGKVHVLDLSGATVAEIPLPPGIVMSDDRIMDVRKGIEARATAGARRRGQSGVPELLSGSAEPFVFRNLPANNAAPAINHMLGDLDGRLWLRLFRPDEEAEYWQVWDIDGPNLEFTLTLPEGEELLDAAGDRVLLRTRDELDLMWNTWCCGRSRDTDGSVPATPA